MVNVCDVFLELFIGYQLLMEGYQQWILFMFDNLLETLLPLNDGANTGQWLIDPSSEQLFAWVSQTMVKICNQSAFFAFTLILIFYPENFKVFVNLRVEKGFKFGLIQAGILKNTLVKYLTFQFHIWQVEMNQIQTLYRSKTFKAIVILFRLNTFMQQILKQRRFWLLNESFQSISDFFAFSFIPDFDDVRITNLTSDLFHIFYVNRCAFT